MEAAGVVDQIGAVTDTDLSVGDHVMAIVDVVPAESVVRAPHGVSDVQAASLPMNGLTARLALDTLGLEAGETVAITGAAGASGGYVVQLAKADGLLRVVADASEQDTRLVFPGEPKQHHLSCDQDRWLAPGNVHDLASVKGTLARRTARSATRMSAAARGSDRERAVSSSMRRSR
jgi:hypothetical protein